VNSFVLVILIMMVVAAALAVVGVYMLAGAPYALIASSILLFGGAFALRAGMTPNG
jgi:hypothetical protein